MIPIPKLGIDYDEPDPTTYRSATLEMRGHGLERFCSGDPTVDLLNAAIVAFHRVGEDGVVLNRSSVVHFAMDGGELNDADPTQDKIGAAIAAAKAYIAAHGGTQ